MPYLHGQQLFGFVDGSVLPPSSYLPDVGGVSLPNPAFTRWFQQDQVILSLLVSSLSEGVLTQVVGLSTSREVWLALQRMFSAHSQARITRIRFQLSTLKKGDSTITDYFQKAKILFDTLAAIGKPLEDCEIVSYLLAGLDTTYDPLITSITRVDPMTLDDVFGHLQTYEAHLEQQTSAVDVAVASANLATNKDVPHSNNRHNGHRGRFSNNNFQRSHGRGRSRGTPTNNQHPSRIQCQVCGKPGHWAISYWRRFDHSFQNSQSLPTAFMATAPATNDTAWYVDSGATHHLTNDFQNLNLHAKPYHGPDQIHVGDGTGLNVDHIGSSKLPLSNNSFLLNKLLHVPSVTKNLISVSQFTTDNGVFIEFHGDHFCIKDEATRNILLQGKAEAGLYPFPSTISRLPQALLSNRAPLTTWHSRLGHPSMKIVRHIISRFSLPITSNKIDSVCAACQQGKSHQLLFVPSETVSKGPLDLIFSD
ncbi:hypothetical protein F2P56_003141, partial [Juglans regia]